MELHSESCPSDNNNIIIMTIPLNSLPDIEPVTASLAPSM